MFKIGEKVKIKDIETLNDEGILTKQQNNDYIVYFDKETFFTVFVDWPFFGKECTIISVDNKDEEIPYYTSLGVWLPEKMLSVIPEKEEVQDIKIQDEPVKQVNDVIPEKRVYINKFNGKKFGDLFVKLIKLDEKIAEFSATTFSNLKSHELRYIAVLLNNTFNTVININGSKKDLISDCYKEAKKHLI